MESSDKGDNRFVVWLSDDYSLPGFFIGSYFFGRTFAPIRTKTSVCGALAHRKEDARAAHPLTNRFPRDCFRRLLRLETIQTGYLEESVS